MILAITIIFKDQIVLIFLFAIIIVAVIVGIGTNDNNVHDQIYYDDNLDNSDYGYYINLDENINNYRVKSYEYHSDNTIYNNFLDIINENNKNYDKFINNNKFYKKDEQEYEQIYRTKSKPIPIPKQNTI